MYAKKIGYLLTLLLFSGLICSVGASATTLSFWGSGVTVDLTFPEEVHPAESIWHNVTITAITATTLRNFTIVIKAPVNSGWQEIFNAQDTFSNILPVSYNLTLSLPQGTNGTLYCFMYVNTSTSRTDDLSATLYTTQVREMTYSELLAAYNVLNNTYDQLVADFDQLVANYNQLLTDYDQLIADFDKLSSDYSTLNDTYNDLQSSYSALKSINNELNSKYNNVDSARTSLLVDISKLQSDYDSLNSTFYDAQGNYTLLQGNFTDLQAVYDEFKETYNDLKSDLNELEGRAGIDQIVMFIFIVTVGCLVAFIIYIKRKQPEPYVVIRKETVAMKPDEKT